MLSVKILEQLKFQKYFLKINGVLPITSSGFLRKRLNNFEIERIIEWSFTIILIIYFILYVATFFKSFEKSLNEITGALTGAIIYGYSAFISIYFKMKRNKFIEMLRFIDENAKQKSAKAFAEVNMNDGLKRACKLSLAWGMICLIGVVTMTLAPILMGKRDLPLKVWYPINDKANLTYEIFYLFEFIAQIQMSLSFINSSGMYLVFMIISCSQFDILFCSLKNFVITAKLTTNSIDKQTLKDLQIVGQKNIEAQQYLYSLERESSLDDDYAMSTGTLIRTYSHNNTQDEQESHMIQKLRDALKNCVEHHVFILNLTKMIEEFFSPVCLVKILQITIQLCLLAFVMIKSTDQDNALVRVVTVLQYLSLTVMELLLLTYYGELITTHSIRLSDAFQRSDWFLYSTKIKQEILIILQNSVRPVVLTAGRIINLDVERFRLTITTAFSFMTLLQKLDTRK